MPLRITFFLDSLSAQKLLSVRSCATSKTHSPPLLVDFMVDLLLEYAANS